MTAQEAKSLNYIPLPKKSRLQRESEHRTLLEKEHSEEIRLQQGKKNKKKLIYTIWEDPYITVLLFRLYAIG